MATAFKELYPDPTYQVGSNSRLLSDDFLVGPGPRQRFVHAVGLPGDLRIETDRPELREEVRQVIDALIEISGLEAGWDTYNARAVDTGTYRPALDLALYAVQRCQTPRLTATSHGGIVLVWEHGDRELELEVATGGEITAFMVGADGEEVEPEDSVSLDDAKGFIDAFCRT